MSGKGEHWTISARCTVSGTRIGSKVCADVTSLANTVGGHLVLGMDEAEGVPTAADGVLVPDIDKEMLRLQQILRSGTQPKLPAVGMHPIRLASGNVLPRNPRCQELGSPPRRGQWRRVASLPRTHVQRQVSAGRS